MYQKHMDYISLETCRGLKKEGNKQAKHTLGFYRTQNIWKALWGVWESSNLQCWPTWDGKRNSQPGRHPCPNPWRCLYRQRNMKLTVSHCNLEPNRACPSPGQSTCLTSLPKYFNSEQRRREINWLCFDPDYTAQFFACDIIIKWIPMKWEPTRASAPNGHWTNCEEGRRPPAVCLSLSLSSPAPTLPLLVLAKTRSKKSQNRPLGNMFSQDFQLQSLEADVWIQFTEALQFGGCLGPKAFLRNLLLVKGDSGVCGSCCMRQLP